MSADNLSEIIQATIDEILKQRESSAQTITNQTVHAEADQTKATHTKINQTTAEIARWLKEPYKFRGGKRFISTAYSQNEKPAAPNPARLNVGRAGTRYLTHVALKFRADHAVAKDAVAAELSEDLASKNGWVSLQTLAKSKEEFLLRPDLGRKLDEKSLKTIQTQGIKNPDIQITIADGLSPWAAEKNAKPFVDELIKLFARDGRSVGTIFCVKYSRIAIQDIIGETLGAKVSMIILGERPGLGGGESLSNYMIYNPKVGAVNALKSMISNIHPAGYSPQQAAELTAHMVKEMFAQKCSGIELKI